MGDNTRIYFAKFEENLLERNTSSTLYWYKSKEALIKKEKEYVTRINGLIAQDESLNEKLVLEIQENPLIIRKYIEEYGQRTLKYNLKESIPDISCAMVVPNYDLTTEDEAVARLEFLVEHGLDKQVLDIYLDGKIALIKNGIVTAVDLTDENHEYLSLYNKRSNDTLRNIYAITVDTDTEFGSKEVINFLNVSNYSEDWKFERDQLEYDLPRFVFFVSKAYVYNCNKISNSEYGNILFIIKDKLIYRME